jgi:predicted alpha-1,2-mannosidase
MRTRPAFVAAGLCLTVAAAAFGQKPRQLVDYVDTNIGGIGQMLQPTYPVVKMPYGLMSVVPITTPGITDRYLADKIYGFAAGGVTMMPFTGAPETDPAKYASLYDHDLETAKPHYYKATLEDHNTQVEYTVSARAACYRIAFPAGAPAHLLFTVPQGAELTQPSPGAVAGRVYNAGWGRTGGASTYFYAEVSNPAATWKALQGIPIAASRRQRSATGLGLMADFPAATGAVQIGVRIGTSRISVDQARQNLTREIPTWQFDRTCEQARQAWNQALGRIAVKGGTEEQRTIFYTALYRVFANPSNAAEDDKYFSPGDRQVHPAGGRGFYPMGGGMWGNYRTLHPLQLLLNPAQQLDLVRSFLTLYDHTGRMLGTGLGGMIGHHVAALVLDLYSKGYRDFDVAKAYEGLKKNAMEATMIPWRDNPLTSLDRVYLEKGFFPALKKGEKETVTEVDFFERRQAVSVTLESAYDDWCTAELAKALGRQADYEYFLKRAYNYRNVWDQRVGFMAPKSADGEWVFDPAEFNPIWGGGQGGREYYTEMNAWTYTFHVQQDVEGLIRLMGGREKFVAKLDQLFQEQYGGYHGDPAKGGANGAKYFFLGQFPDMTGLIGQYSQGDEPSFHIPYLYNYAGAPWKTQRRVREIMKVWYNAGPMGISGDEDNGEESSWYVLSAMGFMTVCPGRPVYDLGSPIFEETRLSLGANRAFTITARNVSAVNKYIQSATLNGKPLNRPWFEHKDMANGGTLVLEMGPRPNKQWGAAPAAAPPSLTK